MPDWENDESLKGIWSWGERRNEHHRLSEVLGNLINHPCVTLCSGQYFAQTKNWLEGFNGHSQRVWAHLLRNIIVKRIDWTWRVWTDAIFCEVKRNIHKLSHVHTYTCKCTCTVETERASYKYLPIHKYKYHLVQDAVELNMLFWGEIICTSSRIVDLQLVANDIVYHWTDCF